MSEANQGVTEFAFMPVAEGSQPGEGHENFFGTSPGFINARYGWQVEDPSVFHWIINWKSLDDHKAFMASPEYPAFVQKIISWAPDLSVFHATLTPHPPTEVFEGLTTELVKLHLKQGVTKEEMTKTYHTFEERLKSAKGYHAHAGGWSIEDDNCAVIVIKWDDTKAHIDWTKSEEGKDILRGEGGLLCNVDKIEMWHINDAGAITPLK
ncbi:hypothetical protein DFP73DRAFT_629068 [Morchella snyderi]|nr:hypothetical protein DFP73DRAFT_629068 [Morchella snyderi]